MTNKNTITGGLIGLIIGLILGYVFAASAGPGGYYGYMHRPWGDDRMYEEMEEHMFDDHDEYEDELITNDGAMQHAMDEMMLGFRGLEGEAYEEMFLRSMIVHHIGAINMAEELLEQTDRPELVGLANTIIETQTAEVATMKAWLAAWYGNEN